MTLNIFGVQSYPQRFLYLRDLYEDNICISVNSFLLVVNQRILNLGPLCWLLSLCRRKKRCLLPRANHLTKPRYVNMINWKDDGQHCIYTCMLLYTYSSSVDINLYETSLGNVIQLAFGKLDDVSGTSFLTFQEQVSWRFRNKFLDVSGTSFLECKCV